MRLRAVLCVVLAAWAGPVLADDSVSFQSPTGNIHCAIQIWDGATEARCDLRDLVQSHPVRPQDCDLDWGSAFALGARGRGVVACVGDTVMDPQNPVLGYGQAMSLGGINCVSAETGMTCTNAEGHGFQVARSRQTLF